MGEQILGGGRTNPGAVVRRGAVVTRPAPPPAGLELLRQVTRVFSGAPRIVGSRPGHIDLEWIEGEAPQRLDETSEHSLAAVGALVRELHDSTAPIARRVPRVRTGLCDPSGPSEVVCHCDPLPGNVVFRDGVPVALIDWEYAAPGRRAWDLAAVLRWWAPFRAPENLRPEEHSLDALARARAVLDGYRATSHLRAASVELMVENHQVAAGNAISLVQARGEERYRSWVDGGGQQRLAADRAWLGAETPRLQAVLTA